MSIQLVLDPTLHVSAREFAAGWNTGPRTNELATAEVRSSGAESYDGGLGEVVLLLTTQMALAVAGNALYDLIKDVLFQRGVRRRITIMEQPQPDGGELLVVAVEEEP